MLASVWVVKPIRVMKVNGGGILYRSTIDRSGFLMKDLSKSTYVGTRKMVNYA